MKLYDTPIKMFAGFGLLVALGLALLLGLAFFQIGDVAAQGPAPSDDEVNAIASQLYCPVCENIPLDVCPTQACFQWRELIREKLAQGWSESEIKDYFVAQYGDRVLAEPPRRGFNWLVYILPPVSLFLGGLVLYGALRNMRRKESLTRVPSADPEQAPMTSEQGDEYLRKVEEELRRRQ